MTGLAAAAAAIVLRGAVAGVTGTVAMTLAMRRVSPRALPPTAQRGFLPEAVVMGLERRISGRRHLRGHRRRQVTMVAHYAYGAGAGLGYSLLRSRFRDAPPAAFGAAWGLAVWAVSYQAWLPALDIVPATTARPAPRWIVPIGAHLLYGAATGLAHEALAAEPHGAVHRTPRRHRPGFGR